MVRSVAFGGIIVMDRGRVTGFDSWQGLRADTTPFRRIVEAGKRAPDRASNGASNGAEAATG